MTLKYRPKYSMEQMIDAIEKGQTALGASKVLGCSPSTVIRYMDSYPEIKEAVLAMRRQLVDLAETGLRQCLINKEPWAISFTLARLGKDRGFSERQEITGVNGGPMQLLKVPAKSYSSEEWEIQFAEQPQLNDEESAEY